MALGPWYALICLSVSHFFSVQGLQSPRTKLSQYLEFKGVMVFNATFNNISVILLQLFGIEATFSS
jgi:hypothetical protein